MHKRIYLLWVDYVAGRGSFRVDKETFGEDNSYIDPHHHQITHKVRPQQRRHPRCALSCVAHLRCRCHGHRTCHYSRNNHLFSLFGNSSLQRTAINTTSYGARPPPPGLLRSLHLRLLLQTSLRQHNRPTRSGSNSQRHRQRGRRLLNLFPKYRRQLEGLCPSVFREARVPLQLPECVGQGQAQLPHLSARNTNEGQPLITYIVSNHINTPKYYGRLA